MRIYRLEQQQYANWSRATLINNANNQFEIIKNITEFFVCSQINDLKRNAAVVNAIWKLEMQESLEK